MNRASKKDSGENEKSGNLPILTFRNSTCFCFLASDWLWRVILDTATTSWKKDISFNHSAVSKKLSVSVDDTGHRGISLVVSWVCGFPSDLLTSMRNFSTTFSAGFRMRFIGPSDLVMVRKFSMSEWFMVRVSCICSWEGGFVYREC